MAGVLLDADCSKDFVRAFILSVRAMAPSEQLFEEVGSAIRLKLLLEARVNERTCRRRRCTMRS